MLELEKSMGAIPEIEAKTAVVQNSQVGPLVNKQNIRPCARQKKRNTQYYVFAMRTRTAVLSCEGAARRIEGAAGTWPWCT